MISRRLRIAVAWGNNARPDKRVRLASRVRVTFLPKDLLSLFVVLLVHVAAEWPYLPAGLYVTVGVASEEWPYRSIGRIDSPLDSSVLVVREPLTLNQLLFHLGFPVVPPQ